MKHVLLSIPNDPELAGRLGKKGASNGITFYNRKTDDSVLVIVTPTDPAAKFNSVAEALTISKDVLISTRNIDRLFGESVIACGLLERTAVLTSDQDASSVMQRSGVQSRVLGEKEILDYFGHVQQEDGGDQIVEIDHSFDVKGVGVVLLGIVKGGTVRVHDELLSGSGKKVTVRSIQSQDEDVKEAGVGTRVGLAVKGVESDELGKGEVLSKNAIKKASSLLAQVRVSSMVKEKGFDYNELWLVCGFRSSMCKVVNKGESYEVQLQAQLQLSKGDRFLLVRKEEPRIFAAGTVL